MNFCIIHIYFVCNIVNYTVFIKADDNIYLVKPYRYTDYCSLSCNVIENTVCERKTCSINKSTCKGTSLPLKREDRYLILTEHNKFRNLTAFGKGQIAITPPIGNMHILSYDIELEFSAQCWANACENDHDKCRRTPHYDSVGQNLFFSKEVGQNPTKSFLKKAIFMWFSEGNQLTQYSTEYQKNYETSNYTQLIWPGTKTVGCGRTVHGDLTVLVCNYAPAGNVEGESLFSLNDPCSGCSKECNFHYTGLCGRSVAYEDDFFAFSVGEPEDGCWSFMQNNGIGGFLCLWLTLLFLNCL